MNNNNNNLMRIIKELIRKILFSFLDASFYLTLANKINWSNDHYSVVVHLIKKFHCFRGWLYYRLRSKQYIAKLRNIHKGQRCFIICNGPSLKKVDLSLLRNEITFGVNSIFLKYEEMGFLPTYYAVMDDMVIEDRRKEINSLTLCKAKKFLPIDSAYALKDDRDVVWINCPDMNGEETIPSFSKCPELFIFHGSTITFICIQLAHLMGCDPVYLIGCDNSYQKPTSIVENDRYWLSKEDDPNHFNPNYFGKGYRWHIPRTDLMERSYKIARWVFEEDNRSLYNATLGGNLEVLERVEFASLFNEMK
jgi:hypothetical protein